MPTELFHCARRGALMVAAAAAVLLTAANQATAVPLYGVTTDDTFFITDTTNPTTITSALPITGFTDSHETIRGIDFRPSNSQLYAMGSLGQLYTVNLLTAALTPVGTPHPINGTSFGFDFNPVNDTIRLISDTDRNYVINPDTGVQTLGPMITFDDPLLSPNIVGLAYTNSSVGGSPPASTTLYGVDLTPRSGTAAGTVTLVTINTDTGRAQPITIFATSKALVGFDTYKSDLANVGVFSMTNDGISIIRTNILETPNSGVLLGGGQIGAGMLVTDIAVTPEPAGAALVAVVAPAVLGRRGRRSRRHAAD